jgi:hypothetical protein
VIEAKLVELAVTWGKQAISATNTKAQQRLANIVGNAGIVAACLRELDRKFTVLFAPLTFFDNASWPMERRRARAEEIMSFIVVPALMPQLTVAIQLLDSATIDDPYLSETVKILCDAAKQAVYRSFQTDVTSPATQGPVFAMWRSNIDPDTQPNVEHLASLLQDEASEPAEIRRAAEVCLTRPSGYVSSPFDFDQPDALTAITSPLREYADYADSIFATIVSVAQESFPAIPAPQWLWSGTIS